MVELLGIKYSPYLECKKLKGKHNLKANIIADGGMKSYSDIIMSLALGADYVMIGSIFNKCLDFKNRRYAQHKENISRFELHKLFLKLQKNLIS